MFLSQDIELFNFQLSHDLPNLWRHEYHYTRQGVFLNHNSLSHQLGQLMDIRKDNDFQES